MVALWCVDQFLKKLSQQGISRNVHPQNSALIGFEITDDDQLLLGSGDCGIHEFPFEHDRVGTDKRKNHAFKLGPLGFVD